MQVLMWHMAQCALRSAVNAQSLKQSGELEIQNNPRLSSMSGALKVRAPLLLPVC